MHDGVIKRGAVLVAALFLSLAGWSGAAAPAAAQSLQSAQSPPFPHSVGRFAPVADLRAGLLLHDVGKGNKESDTLDASVEIVLWPVRLARFENRFLSWLVAPRPVFGGALNSAGDTNRIYAGVNWEFAVGRNWFVTPFFGAVLHDGNLEQATEQCPPGGGCTLPGNRRYVNTGEPTLGSAVLFREAIEAGYVFPGGISLSVIAIHMSNAALMSDNDSMDFIGLRLGLKFDNRPD